MGKAKGGGRQVQHRPEREKAKGRELVETKKEVKQLRRLVSRLQKTIKKYEEERGEPVDLVEASPEPTMVTEEVAVVVVEDQRSCSACQSQDLTEFTTPSGRTIVTCRSCKTRQ